MRVIICGVGQVGFGIADRLTKEGHDVTVIDICADLIDQTCNKLDVRGIIGYASHPHILEEAGAGDADMIIVVTYSDEINIVTCQIASFLFNIPIKIARIRAQAYLRTEYNSLFSNDKFPIDVIISPERELADMVFKRLTLQDAIDVLNFANNKIVALGLECLDNCPVLGTPLRRLTELFPDIETTVVAIKREGKVQIAHSDTELNVGDIVYLVANKDKVTRVFKLFGHSEKKIGRILIAGGGNVGLYVAKWLEEANLKCKISIIEQNRDRAQKISGYLLKTNILHGSALDIALLDEANVEETDLFISLTDNDQVNVLSAILAKQQGCKSNMALVNNSIFQDFIRNIGIDVLLNPRSITISRILQQMRRGRILSVYQVANSQAEIFEGQVLETSALLGNSLSKLKLSAGVRIGAIYREAQVIQPNADTVIKVGDRVIIFALSSYVNEVEYLFRTSFEYIKS